MRFTKGPWLAAATSVYPDREPRGFEIKIQRPIEDSISLEEAQANSHLVAAAPDMYEVLNDVWDALTDGGLRIFTEDQDDYYIRAIEKALKKARGES